MSRSGGVRRRIEEAIFGESEMGVARVPRLQMESSEVLTEEFARLWHFQECNKLRGFWMRSMERRSSAIEDLEINGKGIARQVVGSAVWVSASQTTATVWFRPRCQMTLRASRKRRVSG